MIMNKTTKVLIELNAATMDGDGAAYGMVNDGAIAMQDDQIAWVGPRIALPDEVPRRCAPNRSVVALSLRA